ncbi:MAG: [FeFe] hydrogenase H-cluster radical SAM maturase HydE [Candidatus Raymondbacteria bacterium RifOxyC12_full_50_8]|nr:MAG: [FeFe] hydrogenase H-cluster radical SAM maturase HydE [Candidatus Raymondbacteria bacterium RifOxyC12_full_50_8]
MGSEGYFRGLVEFSNECIFDCSYCGIRKSNTAVERYCLSKDEIIETALWCARQGYGSIVLQSGQQSNREFIELIVGGVQQIKQRSRSSVLPHGLGITLSVGEQSKETYRRFFDAGAHRYLLRVETTAKELFEKFHGPEKTLQRRVTCLETMKKTGFQVGTGVMIGLPGQTLNDLANDILFFKDIDADMIGMGPYLVHHETPMNGYRDEIAERKNEIFQLSLNMIAATRIALKDVNIAATTALQTIDQKGREMGLMYGANVIMPQATPRHVRNKYLLYDGKPCVDESAADCAACLEQRIAATGRAIAWNSWGDPCHFFTRTGNQD